MKTPVTIKSRQLVKKASLSTTFYAPPNCWKDFTPRPSRVSCKPWAFTPKISSKSTSHGSNFWEWAPCWAITVRPRPNISIFGFALWIQKTKSLLHKKSLKRQWSCWPVVASPTNRHWSQWIMLTVYTKCSHLKIVFQRKMKRLLDKLISIRWKRGWIVRQSISSI